MNSIGPIPGHPILGSYTQSLFTHFRLFCTAVNKVHNNHV